MGANTRKWNIKPAHCTLAGKGAMIRAGRRDHFKMMAGFKSSNSMVRSCIAAVGVILSLSVPVGHAAEILDVASRGERTRLLVEGPAKPRAVVILFAGGHGALGIGDHGELAWGRGNFLVRSRGMFQSSGFVTAVIDAPSDRLSSGMLNHFRASDAHAEDVGAAIRALRDIYNVSVWLIGTSRGTNSVANAAIRLEADRPDGIVLTSSMLRFNSKGPYLLQMDLDVISMPTLIVHHVHDACKVTPFDKVSELAAALGNAKTAATFTYAGGAPTDGGLCGANHYHGFRGIEEKVVHDISEWILATG